MSDAPEPLTYHSRGDTVRATSAQKREAAFAGRHFEVVRAVHLPADQVFVTQFGHKGRHGFVIRDTETGAEQVVGLSLLRLIHDRFGGVELPTRRRYTRKNPTS